MSRHAPVTPFRWLYPFDYPLLVYVAAALWCAHRFSLPINWSVLWDFRFDVLLLLQGAPICLLVAYVWMRIGQKRSFGEVRELFWQTAHSFRGWRRWYKLLRTIAAAKLCLTIYSHLKQEIPLFNPGIYDTQLERLDRWVHLGFSPVDALVAAFSAPPVARGIDVLYILWYFLKAHVMVLFLFHPAVSRRWHFFTCYVLMWMIGGSLAIAFPSLGPVYIEPDTFQGLATPSAHQLQDMLWQHYQQLLADPASYRVFIYEGIAAFPSLHVGLIVLFTLMLWPYRAVFWVFATYSLVVQIGSVLLGWHYAVDGYAAAALAAGIFYVTRRLVMVPAAALDGGPGGAS